MNNIINFYYGINVIDVYKDKEKYIFKYNDNNYYFMEYDRDKKDIKSLIEVINELKRRNIITNEFVCNKFNNYFTPFNNKNYILIREQVKKYKISFNDILYIQNNTLNITFDKNIVRTNYINLWKNKIDFYETKIDSKYKMINDTLDYYIGLGENAISYIVNNNVGISNMVLSHRRLSIDSFNFYNPLNYIIDNRSRDIADYIKELFFNENISYELVLSLLRYSNFNREEFILFISRMLYPTYYFDLVDRIIFDNEDENILRNIINKNNDYISLLKRIFYYINYDLRMNIPVIEWIIKM